MFLSYYRARYYDTAAGHFVSEDPIRFGGGPNFYRFVNNDPITDIDPSGEDVEVVCVPVEQKYLGIWAGARHCAIHIHYDNVDTMLERLGPTTLNQEQWNGRVGIRPVVRRPTGDRCKDFEKCILKKFEFFQKSLGVTGPEGALAPYDPINSNSNAFVLELIRSCGGDIQFPPVFSFTTGYNFFRSDARQIATGSRYVICEDCYCGIDWDRTSCRSLVPGWPTRRRTGSRKPHTGLGVIQNTS